MESDKSVVIIIINKRKISYYKKKIPEENETIQDLDDHIKEKEWIEKYIVEKKPIFLYVNQGNILKNTDLIADCKKDIMLIMYLYVNYVTQSYTDSIFSLSQSIIDNFTNGDIPSGYNLLPSSFSSINNNNTSFSFTNLDANNNLTGATSNINISLDNESNSINNSTNISGISELTGTDDISGVSESVNDNQDSNSINDSTDNQDNQNIIESTSNIINLLQNSLISANANILSNTNITAFPDFTSNISTDSYDLQHIRELYLEQYTYMLSLGFTDINRILQSLFVSEGNIENATNYYLS